MSAVTVPVKILPHGKGLALPAYATEGSAGVDLAAALETPLLLPPGGRAEVPTGVALALPPGWEGQVRPRSGLASKHGLTVLNSPGTIDADYRGEIRVILVNLGGAPGTIARGERIAQLIVAPVGHVAWQVVTDLPDSRRSAGGFGSTGT